MSLVSYDSEMAQEVSERLILHWYITFIDVMLLAFLLLGYIKILSCRNYRGFSSLPEELHLCGRHVCELYLKYNNITSLVHYKPYVCNIYIE